MFTCEGTCELRDKQERFHREGCEGREGRLKYFGSKSLTLIKAD